MKPEFQLVHEYDEDLVPKADAVLELKEDGVMAIWNGPRHQLIDRRGTEISARFPGLVPILPSDAVLVGEVCIYDSDGVSDFYETLHRGTNEKQNRMYELTTPSIFVAFDVLEVGAPGSMSPCAKCQRLAVPGRACTGCGTVAPPASDGPRDVSQLTLRERRKILDDLVAATPADARGVRRLTRPKVWDISEVQRATAYVWQTGNEGLVIKSLAAKYEPTHGSEKRSSAVMKWKAWNFRVYPILRPHPTEDGGFNAVIQLANGTEQDVAVQSSTARASVAGGKARAILVRYLEDTPDGRLRQPSCRGVYDDVAGAEKAAKAQNIELRGIGERVERASLGVWKASPTVGGSNTSPEVA